MLSNRITANKRDENPDIHANNKTVNVIKLFHPDEFDIDDFINLADDNTAIFPRTMYGHVGERFPLQRNSRDK
jgi:hypothetical protein